MRKNDLLLFRPFFIHHIDGKHRSATALPVLFLLVFFSLYIFFNESRSPVFTRIRTIGRVGEIDKHGGWKNIFQKEFR